MKAEYAERQPPVRWQPLEGDRVDVLICLHEQARRMLSQGEEQQQTIYEYDCNQFREYAKNISKTDIMSNLEKYLAYVPQEEKTLEKMIKEQATQIDILAGGLVEMSKLVYM